jgi:hypothetical protein
MLKFSVTILPIEDISFSFSVIITRYIILKKNIDLCH